MAAIMATKQMVTTSTVFLPQPTCNRRLSVPAPQNAGREVAVARTKHLARVRMLRIALSDEDRAAAQLLRRDPSPTPLERDVAIVWPAAAGWSAPRIAAHLDRCAASVRTLLKRFPAEQVACLPCQRPGPPANTTRRVQVTAALDGGAVQCRPRRTGSRPQHARDPQIPGRHRRLTANGADAGPRARSRLGGPRGTASGNAAEKGRRGSLPCATSTSAD